MTNIALTLTINKYTNYFESITYYFIGDSLENIKIKLVNQISDHLKHTNISFPLDLVDFEYLWFKEQYVKSNVFVYKVFADNAWSEPWEYQDIYDEVLENIHSYEINNIPDFSKMYGEPNPDEESDDNFKFENDENIHEFETKLKEIISQSENPHNDETIPDCACEQCQEGYRIQQMKKELESEFDNAISK